MITKRLYTIEQLQALMPILDFKSEKVKRTVCNDDEIIFREAVDNSNFFFRLSLTGIQEEKEILITMRPIAVNNMGPASIVSNLFRVDEAFARWIDLIHQYNSIVTEEEVILNAYTKQYEDELALTDDESASEPLTVRQALYLDQYLQHVEENIEAFKTEDNVTTIEEIKEDVSLLRQNITNVTKSHFVKKLSSIMAKMTKSGLKIVKELLTEALKEKLKDGLNWSLTNAPELLDSAAKHFIKHP